MSSAINTISKASYSETVDWLEASLAEMKISQKEILTAELLLEECFLRLSAASGNEEDFSAKIKLRKRLGDVSLTLFSKGEAYNPMVSMNDTVDDDEEMYTIALLKAHRNELRYHRRQSENVISIRVHESSSKNAIYTVVGFVAGILLGFVMKALLNPELLLLIEKNIFTPIETIFIHALMMTVAPMIFFSVISGITGMSDTADIGRLGGKLIVVSVMKLGVILGIGLFFGFWLDTAPELLAMIAPEGGGGEIESMSISAMLVGIVPDSLIEPFATNSLLQVLFLACFFGTLLAKSGERAAWLKEHIDFFNGFIMDATGVIMPLMPLVVTVSMAKLMINTELSVLLVYGKIIASCFVGFVFILLVSAFFTVIVGRMSPIPLIKKLAVFCALPFLIRSSSACLPETMKFCKERMGMEEKLSQFTIPVGMQFNMTGSGIFLVMLALLMRQTMGLPVDMDFMLTFFFSVLILTFAFPSVPGATIIVLASIFEMAGVPTAAVTLFIGIEPLVDGAQTAGNVAGDVVSSFLVACIEGKVDEEVYKAA